MNYRHARRYQHPAVRFADICLFHFGLPKHLTLQWWEGMRGSPNPHIEQTLRTLINYHGRTEDFLCSMWRTLPPKTLIATVEVLCDEERLSRADATMIEEAILGLVEEAGSWRPRAGQGEKQSKRGKETV